MPATQARREWSFLLPTCVYRAPWQHLYPATCLACTRRKVLLDRWWFWNGECHLRREPRRRDASRSGAGLPWTIVFGGTDLVTTLPSSYCRSTTNRYVWQNDCTGPTEASSSITTPLCPRLCATIVTLIPIAAPSRIVTRCGDEVSIIAS